MEALFRRGTLPDAIREATRRGRASGALEPILTELLEVEDGGVPFAVRVVGPTDRKHASRREQDRTGRNPFLPPYDLLVADVSETHVALLNKFPVVDNHIIVVTRRFERQDSLLTAADFEALWICLQEIDALGFYNGGDGAGASQPHKHLQVVPLPLGGPSADPIPAQPLLAAARLPIAVARKSLEQLGDGRGSGEELASIYRDLLASLDLYDGRGDPTAPYNLLATREWMWIAPRTRNAWKGLAVNALGIAGAFFVRSPEQLEYLLEAGPLHVLSQIGRPRQGASR